jgi:hypothetical protein
MRRASESGTCFAPGADGARYHYEKFQTSPAIPAMKKIKAVMIDKLQAIYSERIITKYPD